MACRPVVYDGLAARRSEYSLRASKTRFSWQCVDLGPGPSLAAEELVTAGQEQHPEWDWPFLATVLWVQRGQVQEEPPRQPAWRWWLRWLVDGGHR